MYVWPFDYIQFECWLYHLNCIYIFTLVLIKVQVGQILHDSTTKSHYMKENHRTGCVVISDTLMYFQEYPISLKHEATYTGIVIQTFFVEVLETYLIGWLDTDQWMAQPANVD